MSIGMLALTTLVAGIVLVSGRGSLESGQGDEIGTLILLGLLTVLGLLIGVVTLVVALVVYGRGRPAGQTLLVVLGSLAVLVTGGALILWAAGDAGV